MYEYFSEAFKGQPSIVVEAKGVLRSTLGSRVDFPYGSFRK